MLNIRNFLSRKGKYLAGAIVLLYGAVICLAFSKTDEDDFNSAKREVLLRRIGHELLLQSGDSTSRVLPVKKIAENEYQVSFENEFAFQPDSLVSITRRFLRNDRLGGDYVVSVINCGTSNVAYGYAIAVNKSDDVIACIGRKQPKGCYIINIKFKPEGIKLADNNYLLGSIPLLAFVAFILLRPVKPRKAIIGKPTDVLTLGNMQFDTKNRKLTINGKSAALTITETRVLLIFALSPNETIERSRLQKEIWEDEGIIVGRSLDMFISKLRKKLELDPDINLVVIRGRGYRLEISS